MLVETLPFEAPTVHGATDTGRTARPAAAGRAAVRSTATRSTASRSTTRPAPAAAHPADVTGLATPPSSRWVAEPTTELPTVPAHAFPHRSASQLLALARRGLDDAAEQRVDGLRYAAAHLAALRAAAAVVAARSKPVPTRRSTLTSVWDLLTLVAPALGEWAAFFAASAGKRAAAEAGIPRVVTAREADDLVRAATSFVSIIEVALGRLARPALLDDLVA